MHKGMISGRASCAPIHRKSSLPGALRAPECIELEDPVALRATKIHKVEFPGRASRAQTHGNWNLPGALRVPGVQSVSSIFPTTPYYFYAGALRAPRTYNISDIPKT